MFFRSTLVAHKTARKPYFMGACSSLRDNSNEYQKRAKIPENIEFSGIF